MAVPMVISNSCDSFMTATDRYFLSRLGSDEMAACMAGGLFSFTVMALPIGLVGYSTAMVAQRMGAGRHESCAQVLRQALIFCLMAYPVILCLLPLGIAFFGWTGVSDEQRIHQDPYFSILCAGSIVPMVRIALGNFFTGLGRTRVVMVSSFTTMIFNVAANYLLIFGGFGIPAMGIRGAAIGTLLAGLVGIAVLLISFFHSEHRAWMKWREGIHRPTLKEILRKGFPAGLEIFLIVMAFSIIIMAFHAHSRVTAAASTIVFNWDMMTFIPLMGLEISITSLVGRYVGAGDLSAVHRVVMSGAKVGVSYCAIVAISFAFFPEPLVMVFRPDRGDEVLEQSLPMAITMLRIASIYVLIEALIVVFAGALRGAGDTFAAMVISVSIQWSLAIALVLSLHVFGMHPVTAWWILTILFFLMCTPFWLRYRSGKWKEKLPEFHSGEAPVHGVAEAPA